MSSPLLKEAFISQEADGAPDSPKGKDECDVHRSRHANNCALSNHNEAKPVARPIVTGTKYNALLNGLAEDEYLGMKEKSAPKRGILTALKPMGMPTYRW